MRIWAWGANSNSQLGFDFKCEQISTPRNVPFHVQNEQPGPIADSSSFQIIPVKICGGAYHTLFLVEKAHNDDKIHQLKVTPQFHIMMTTQVSDISAGWNFNSCISKPHSRLVSFGENITYGQLGYNCEDEDAADICKTISSLLLPDRFAIYVNPPIAFSSIAAGVRFSVGLDTDFRPYFWGDNSKSFFSVNCTNNNEIIETPTLLNVEQPGIKFRTIRCGKSFVLALSQNNCIYGCGLNKFGVLLKKDRIVSTLTLIWQCPFDEEIVDIQCGWTHALMLTKSGKIFSWGRNNFFQLGRNFDGDFDSNIQQVDIPDFAVAISCGSEHNLSLTSSNKVFSWGWNEHDNCGVPSAVKESVPLPTEVQFPEQCVISIIGCGPGSSFAVSD